MEPDVRFARLRLGQRIYVFLRLDCPSAMAFEAAIRSIPRAMIPNRKNRLIETTDLPVNEPVPKSAKGKN
jgi:hypothetical protein